MDHAVCESCGGRNNAIAEFCRNCGAYLGWEGAARPVTVVPDDAAAGVRGRPLAPKAAPGAFQTGPTVDLPPPCEACGTRGEGGRAFCRRCGRMAAEVAPPPTQPVPVLPWWRRWRTAEAERARAARAAYRRSLPVRFRATRALLAAGCVAVVAGAVSVADRDPLGWARATAADVRGTTSVVEVRQVSAVPPPAAPSAHPPEHAFDDFLDSYWETSLTDAPPLDTGCSEPEDLFPGGVLVLDLGRATAVREVWVTPGPPEKDPQRAEFAKPTAVLVRFDDRVCRRLVLEPEPTPQRLDVRLTARRITVAVVAAQPASDAGPVVRVGVADVRVRSRR